MKFNFKVEKNEILILELIFIFACFLRLLYFYQISATPFFDPTNDQLDQSYYHHWALGIAHGDFWGKEVFYGLPLYPYLLSFVYFWLGPNIDLVKFIQLVLGAVNCLLVYGLAKKVFNKTVAVISALVTSAYGVLLFYEEMLLPVGLAIFLTDLALILFLSLSKRPTCKKWLISGIIFGLSCLTQASNFLFIIFILFWIWFTFKERKKIFFYTLSFLFGLILVIAPVSLRNYLVAKDLVLVTYHSGINFYAGNNSASDGLFNLAGNIRPSIKGMQEDSRQVAEKALGRHLRASEISHFWFKKGLEFIKNNPVRASQLFFKKIYFFWNGYEISDIHNFYFVKKYAPILNLTFFNFYLIGALGLFGIILSFKRKEGLILILFIVSTLLATASFFITSRYRLIVVGVLIIFASYGFYWFIQQALLKNYKALVKPAFVLGSFFVLLNIKIVEQGYQNEYFYFGNYYLKNNQLEQAKKQYQKVLAVTPDYVDAYYNLGVVYYKQAEIDTAIDYFKKALSYSPDYGDVHYNLGMAYEEKSLPDLARQEYLKAIAVRAADIDARYHLANIYYQKGMFDLAINSYREILNIDPRLIQVHNGLGKSYQKKGLLTEARQEFIIALKIDPLYAPSRINLAKLEKEAK